MNEIPILEIGAGGAFALLVIKEVRHWTQSLMMKKNGGNGSGSATIFRKHGERIKANETNIENIKDGIKDMKGENKKDHDEIKALIKNGGN